MSVPSPNYTQVPNVIFDLIPQMKEAELRVVMVIIRNTFGWHRESKKFSIAELQKLCSLSRQGVINGLESGMQRGLITREKDGDSYRYKLDVHEVDTRNELVNLVDHLTIVSSQPSRPDLVNQVDQKTGDLQEGKGTSKESIKEITTTTKEKSGVGVSDHEIVAPAPPAPPAQPLPVEEKVLPTVPTEQQPIPPCEAPLPVAVDALKPPTVQKTYKAAEGFKALSDDPEWKTPSADPHASRKPLTPDPDPRLIGPDKLIESGKGRTMLEIWRESYEENPTAPQRRWIKENVTDPAKWRKVTAECGLRGFKSFKNVKEVYEFGFRDEHQNGASKNTPTNGKPGGYRPLTKTEHSMAAVDRVFARLAEAGVIDDEGEQ